MTANSEAILAVTADDPAVDVYDRIAITGSIDPDPDTHIEAVTYGDGGDGPAVHVADRSGHAPDPPTAAAGRDRA